MACFIVPATEAIVTTIAGKIARNHEQQDAAPHAEAAVSFSEKLGWLNKMLWGGSALLAFEHLWHGELIPFFPFLTNAANAVSAAEMLREAATSGVGMAALVTAVWGVMVAVSNRMHKQAPQTAQPALETEVSAS